MNVKRRCIHCQSCHVSFYQLPAWAALSVSCAARPDVHGAVPLAVHIHLHTPDCLRRLSSTDTYNVAIDLYAWQAVAQNEMLSNE